MISVSDHAFVANGKIANDINESLEILDTESNALDALLLEIDSLDFAWEDSLTEAGLKLDLNNSSATYYPEGELLWALDSALDSTGFKLPDDAYRIAYKFTIHTVNPRKIVEYYVDGNTLDIFRTRDTEEEGWATTLNHGSQSIDTKKKIPGTNYILKTDEASREIHTRYENSNNNWFFAGDIKDSDDNWGTNEQYATTVHFGVIKSWDYFKKEHGKLGMSFLTPDIRVWASSSSTNSAKYNLDTKRNKNYIFFTNTYSLLDVSGHEFTHGVIRHALGGKQTFGKEPEAIEEGFCDIFGTMVEEFVEGSSADWDLGEDGITKRSLENPPLFDHPDTYKGSLWDSPLSGDELDHVNNGVFNKQFYLLAQGDYHNNVNVAGIGLELAARIQYLSMYFQFQTSSQFIDMRSSNLAIAALLGYPECSAVHNQVKDSWAAVGVGSKSNCVLASNSIANASKSVHLFPNPASNELSVVFDGINKPKNLSIIDIKGQTLLEFGIHNTVEKTIDVSTLLSGTYIVSIESENNKTIQRFIKK